MNEGGASYFREVFLLWRHVLGLCVFGEGAARKALDGSPRSSGPAIIAIQQCRQTQAGSRPSFCTCVVIPVRLEHLLFVFVFEEAAIREG